MKYYIKIGLLISLSFLIWDQGFSQFTERNIYWDSFKEKEGKTWQVKWDTKINVPKAIYNGASKEYSGNPESVARQFLSEYRNLFSMKENLSDLVHKYTKTNRGVHHVTFQQTYKGVLSSMKAKGSNSNKEERAK